MLGLQKSKLKEGKSIKKIFRQRTLNRSFGSKMENAEISTFIPATPNLSYDQNELFFEL